MCAAQHGYAEIIECLVTQQAMALCEDKEGNIAVDMIKGSPKALNCLGEETLVCCLVLSYICKYFTLLFAFRMLQQQKEIL